MKAPADVAVAVGKYQAQMSNSVSITSSVVIDVPPVTYQEKVIVFSVRFYWLIFHYLGVRMFVALPENCLCVIGSLFSVLKVFHFTSLLKKNETLLWIVVSLFH